MDKVRLEPKEVTIKTGEKIVIREVMPDDAEKLVPYLNIVGGESENLLIEENDFGMTVEEEREYIKSLNKKEDSIMILATAENGEIISTAQLNRISTRSRAKHRAEIAISVKKDYWAVGVGTAMMQTLFDFGKSIGIEIVQLEVRAKNEGGIALYKKMGFEKVGEIKKGFKFPDRYEDEDIMQVFI